ncbi:MAG: phosphodiesterase [Rhodobacteraceae bacterium]|nr:phosphodiesterase [Paracoccaceae bacterium]
MPPVTFLHLTDLHISAPEANDTSLHSDTLTTLDAVLDRIAGMDAQPDFVVVSGDLTNLGDEASYRLLAGRLQRIAPPLVLALGNHDRRAEFRQVMLGEAMDAPYAHDVVLAGVQVIVLDSLVPGRVAGALGPDQFAFLDAALNRHPDLPKLVVVHHPPALDPEAEITWHALDWDDSTRLAGMLKGRGVVAMLCGHVHVPRVTHWHGIPVIVGNGQHNTIDPLITSEMRITDGTGFGLCTLRPSGLTVEFVAMPQTGRVLDHVSLEALRRIA